MKQKFIRVLCLAGCLSFLLSAAVYALTLEEARVQGRVGETESGYLGAVQSDAETTQLVARINSEREQQYRLIAQENHISVKEVLQIAGKKLVARAAKGEYIRSSQNQWVQQE
ncbi:MAG: YdbL family protein [Enterobacteriaceae bacterium]